MRLGRIVREQMLMWAHVFITESPLSDKAGYYIAPIDFEGGMIEGWR